MVLLPAPLLPMDRMPYSLLDFVSSRLDNIVLVISTAILPLLVPHRSREEPTLVSNITSKPAGDIQETCLRPITVETSNIIHLQVHRFNRFALKNHSLTS